MNTPSPTFHEGAHTVLGAAAHFGRLKESAARLRDVIGARERGYFTPAEDEQARHLLVSYTKSRAALLELIATCQADPQVFDPEDLRLFATAYAAALLLIDAARFLRDSYDGIEPIVQKLNEAEPVFGIPAGTYDTIQLSLTSPQHAWRLYQANEIYAENAAALQARSESDPLLAGLLAVITAHLHRVQVSKTEYAKARLQVQAHQVIESVRRTAIGQGIYVLQELVSRLASALSTSPSHRAQVPAEVAHQILGLLRPGDVFVTRKDHAVTNYFLPGYWPHAALYLGDAAALRRLGVDGHEHVRARWPLIAHRPEAQPQRVLEALKDGVRIRCVASALSNDAVAVIRPQLDESQVASALARGLSHEGKPYDFDFDFTRSDRMVCTEVVYRSYDGIGPMRFELARRVGRMTLAAEDLLRLALDRELFVPVACYCPARAGELAVGNEAEALLRATLPST